MVRDRAVRQVSSAQLSVALVPNIYTDDLTHQECTNISLREVGEHRLPQCSHSPSPASWMQDSVERMSQVPLSAETRGHITHHVDGSRWGLETMTQEWSTLGQLCP